MIQSLVSGGEVKPLVKEFGRPKHPELLQGLRTRRNQDRHCVRSAVLSHRNLDYGRLYENLVCIELRRHGHEVYAGKLYRKKVVFAALRGSEKLYIQVSDDISVAATFDRKGAPRPAIRGACSKIILARPRRPGRMITRELPSGICRNGCERMSESA